MSGSSIEYFGIVMIREETNIVYEFRTSIFPDERTPNILYRTVHAVGHLSLAQTSHEKAC